MEAWGPAYVGWEGEEAEEEELVADSAVEELVAEQEFSFAMDASTYALVTCFLLGTPATGIALPTPHFATEVTVPGIEDEVLSVALLPRKAPGSREGSLAVPPLVRVPIGVRCFCAERVQDLKITATAVVMSSAL